jgi:putative toxin-antitoxin system antitoxin component (TIGR02293 family)
MASNPEEANSALVESGGLSISKWPRPHLSEEEIVEVIRRVDIALRAATSVKRHTVDTALEDSMNSIAMQTEVFPTRRLWERWIAEHLPTSQIEEILSLAAAVIGDRERAAEWLSEPNPALDNRSPLNLIGEKDGFDRVKHLLLRIEYGVLA